jgi:ketosteroid isomerase-like protein
VFDAILALTTTYLVLRDNVCHTGAPRNAGGMRLQGLDPIEVEQWLDRFAACVRARDYSGGRELFADDVVGFGTYTPYADGLDELVQNQWEPVWSATRDFRFDLAGARVQTRGDLAWVAAGWSSTGIRRSGHTFERRGRVTIVLRRDPAGWSAVHTHLSHNPNATLDGRASS